MVDGFRRRARELFKAANLGKAKQSFSGCHPPFASVILESNLIPTPAASLLSLLGQIRRHRRELFPVELVDEFSRDAGTDNTNLALLVGKDGSNPVCAQPVFFTIGRKAFARQLQRAITCQPEIAFAVFGDRPDGQVSQTVARSERTDL